MTFGITSHFEIFLGQRKASLQCVPTSFGWKSQIRIWFLLKNIVKLMGHLYFYTESKLSRILFSIWILGVKIQITHSKSKINLDFMRENSNEKFKVYVQPIRILCANVIKLSRNFRQSGFSAWKFKYETIFKVYNKSGF